MNEHSFQQFINLVQFDQQIHLLETEILKIDREIDSIKDYDKRVNSELEVAKLNIIQLKKQVDILELEMKSLDQQEKEKKLLFENVSNYKEHQSIKTEIEAIQKLQLNQEQDILKAWNSLESAQASFEVKKRETSALLVEHQSQLQEKQTKHSTLVNELSVFTAQRHEKERTVPQEWLEKYSVMRARVADPVVPIEHQSCSVCFQLITNQDIIRAKKGALLQCKGCFRLLFSPETINSTQTT